MSTLFQDLGSDRPTSPRRAEMWLHYGKPTPNCTYTTCASSSSTEMHTDPTSGRPPPRILRGDDDGTDQYYVLEWRWKCGLNASDFWLWQKWALWFEDVVKDLCSRRQGDRDPLKIDRW